MKLLAVIGATLSLNSLVFAQARTVVTMSGSQVQIENAHIRVTLAPEQGRFSVLDKRCGYLWSQAPDVRFAIRNVTKVSDGVTFETDLPLRGGANSTLRVTMTVPRSTPELHISAEAVGQDEPFEGMLFLAPLMLDTPDGVMVIADYSNGRLLPLHLKPFPVEWRTLDRLDMPWVGVCDLRKGFGYALIVETADDGVLNSRHHKVGERELVAPQVGWWGQKGRFAYTRRMFYRFEPSGGYVALAKAYRDYARRQGLLVTLVEKLKRNPNLRRLFGAVDVWGIWGVDYAQFVQEARFAGITRMILHGRASREQMQGAVGAGFITSEYDNYTDILAVESEDKIDSNHDLLPQSAVLKADGERMTAWRTMEGLQYMKRCPALWVRTATKVIPKALEEHPFVGRFIDVTTAEGLYECYDPAHPLTRTQKREAGVQLLSYVRSLGLVVGGEHGIWWGVPYLDYIEGMMSVYTFSWPAGHLIHPESKEQSFTDPWGNKLPPYPEYEKWGIGHEYRVPLWELVFHDCVVSTWYWGDASDWLLRADPENMARKDLFNILYGTIPLLWIEPEGSWHKDRRAFLRTCYLTSKLHEAVATHEMLSHEFVTPDRAVQRTRFADGTEVVVNFGQEPYSLSVRGRKVVLPEHGFWVQAPKVQQSRLLIDGRVVTTVKAEGFWFRETASEWVMMRRVDAEHVRLEAYSASGMVKVNLRDVVGRWDRNTTLVYQATPSARGMRVPVRWQPDGAIMLKTGSSWDTRSSFDVLCGKRTRLPDVSVQLRVDKAQCQQGEAVKVTLAVQNSGFAPARNVNLALYADRPVASHRLWQGNLSVGARSQKQVVANIRSDRLDGARLLLAQAVLAGGVSDISKADNSASVRVHIARDLRRWDYQRLLKLEAGSVDREDEVVLVTIEQPAFTPESVRIYLSDETGSLLTEIPAQCDRLPDGRMEIAFVVPGRMPAHSVKWVKLLAMSKPGAVLAPSAPREWNDRLPFIQRETYALRLRDGVPRDLAAVSAPADTPGEPFIAQLVFSSAKTGWVEENSVAPAQVRLISNGPVRTVVEVQRDLAGGVNYTKRYLFYPRFFDVEINTSTSEGTYSRAFYLQDGDYEDSGGVKARVDGKGDAEGVLGTTRQPRWYAVTAPRWAHACLALTPADAIVYWDSQAKGGIGFNTGATKDVRLRYVVLPGAGDASFAELWYRRAVEPVRVVWNAGQR